MVLLRRRRSCSSVVWLQFYFFQRNKPEDVGLAADRRSGDARVDESKAAEPPPTALDGPVARRVDQPAASSAASTSSRSSSATRCGRGRRTSSSDNYGLSGERGERLRDRCSTSAASPACSSPAGSPTATSAAGAPASRSIMMIGMTVATGLLDDVRRLRASTVFVDPARRASASRCTAPTRCSPAPARWTSAAARPRRSRPA